MNSLSRPPVSQAEIESPASQPSLDASTNDAPVHSAAEVAADGIALGVFDAQVVEIAPRVMLRFYLVLWLLLLLYLAYKIWQWQRRRKRRALRRAAARY